MVVAEPAVAVVEAAEEEAVVLLVKLVAKAVPEVAAV